jgi:hypothetical protein
LRSTCWVSPGGGAYHCGAEKALLSEPFMAGGTAWARMARYARRLAEAARRLRISRGRGRHRFVRRPCRVDGLSAHMNSR